MGIEERDLLVGPGAVEGGDGGIEGLEIEEADRVMEPVQELPDRVRVRVLAPVPVELGLHPLGAV